MAMKFSSLRIAYIVLLSFGIASLYFENSGPFSVSLHVLAATLGIQTCLSTFRIRNLFALGILEGLVYLGLSIALSNTDFSWLLLTFILFNTLVHEPKSIHPNVFSEQLFSTSFGMALITVRLLLSMVKVKMGWIENSELPIYFHYSQGILVIVTILSLLARFQKTTFSEMEKKLAVKEKKWTLDVMSLLSHNIRTPLATLTNRIEIMKLKLSNGSEISPEDITLLSHGNNQVLSIVNQLLNKTAKASTKGVSSIEASSVLKSIKHERLEILNPNKLDFKISVAESITLELALDSLVSNALRHSDGVVSVRVFMEKQNYVIEVCDRGEGMTPVQQEHYGTPFNIQSSTGGTGLGVYFVLSLVQSNDWEWEMNSRLAHGTSVKILIPILSTR
jgi:signal transduction histidine kinase